MSKKNVAAVVNASVTSESEVDGLMKASDIIVDMSGGAPKKPEATPTVKADVDTLAKDLQKRGGVNLQIREGTEKLLGVNQTKEINNGKSDVFTLTLGINKEGKGTATVSKGNK